MSTRTIHAIQVHDYGDANQLRYEQIEMPEPQAGQVLTRVYAAGVNPVDWKIRSGMARNFMPATFPYIPGADFAGVVEKVGPGVTNFHPGQEVFGGRAQGAYTEYALAAANTMALKPKSISFEDAAAIPIGATTAWQGLFDHGQLQPGQRVLILGGAGGVGLFAVQFARWKGAEVISTTSTKNVDFVRSLGAQQIIDYTKNRVEDVVQNVDLVLDTVGGQPLATVWPTLKRGGTLITIAGQPDEDKARELGVRTGRFSAQITGDLLQQFVQLIEEGQIKVFVSDTFPLEQAAQAQQLSESGHGRGRIVLQVAK